MPTSFGSSQVGGLLSDISAASDGTVWGVNSAGDIYQYVGQYFGGTFQQVTGPPVPGGVSAVAVGSATNFWSVDGAGKVYNWESSAVLWEQIHGVVLLDISVASDGTVVGVDGFGNVQSYHGGSWTQIPAPSVPGGFSAIAAVSATKFWGVTSAGDIYHYVGGTWAPVTGSLSDISAASDGTVWGVNKAGDILQYVGGTMPWQQVTGPGVPSGLSVIAVGSATNIWGADDASNIYQFFPLVTQPSGGYSGNANYVFANGSDCASLTGVSAMIVVKDDLVWKSSVGPPGFSIQLNAETHSTQPLNWLQFMIHIGDDQGLWPYINIWQPSSPMAVAVGSQSNIWRLNTVGDIYQCVGGTWGPVNGPALSDISAASDGTVWGVNSAGDIYSQYNQFGGATIWTQVPGPVPGPGVPGGLRVIAVGSATNIWGVDEANNVFQYESSSGQWKLMPGITLLDISVASEDGAVWGVNSAGDMVEYVGRTTPWNPVNGPGVPLVRIAAGNANFIWGLDGAGDIYFYNGGTWETIDGNLSDISAASDGAVWGVNSAGEIYQYYYVGGPLAWQKVPGSFLNPGITASVWGGGTVLHPVANLPQAARIPANYRIIIDLLYATDSSGNVVGADLDRCRRLGQIGEIQRQQG